MKYTIFLLILSLAGASLPAQSPDPDRMQRDIEVAENILASLLEENTGETGYSYPVIALQGNNVEGTYLDGFGVLLTIAPRHLFRGFRLDRSREPGSTPRGGVIIIPDGQRPEGFHERKPQTPYPDSFDTGARFKKIVETFATDYAYLLRQLPAGEKLMIRYGSSADQEVTWRVAGLSGGPGEESIRSALINKADINAFQSGRLKKETFLSRIRFTIESGHTNKQDRDLVLLSSIFSRLYESDLSKTFYLHGSVDFERIDGLGAIYHFTLGPKSGRGAIYFSDGQRLRLRDRGGVVVPMPENADPADGEISKLETAYPAFLETLKANIIEYGSIVKNLAPGEALIFRINFTGTSDSTTIPEKLKITCRQATLDSYRQNKISLEKAVTQLRAE